MPIPNLGDMLGYLGDSAASYDYTEVGVALAAETAAQANVCQIPDPYPDDLAEALKRRVHHNLALRGVPLGIQASISDSFVATNRVGGTDPEVARLERPYRKLVVG